MNDTLDELFGEIKRTEQTRSRGARGGADEGVEAARAVLLLNKIDRLRDNAALLEWEQRVPGCIAIQREEPDGGRRGGV